MKKIFTLILFAFITIIAIGQDKKETLNNGSPVEKEYSLLKAQYSEILKQQGQLENKRNELYKTLKEERKNHQDFVQNIYLWVSIFISIIGVALGTIISFLGYKTRKEVKEKIDEYKIQLINESQEKLEAHKIKLDNDAKEKLESHKNEIVIQCSKLLSENPFHIKELIDERISDYEVKQNNKIQLIYHKDESESMNKIYNQLKYYGFILGESIPFSDYNQIPYENYSEDIVYFIIDNNEKDESNKKPTFNIPTNLCFELNNGNHNNTPLQKCNIFYQGDSFLTFKAKQQNFAKTPTTIYNNLMDLLRYVEYEKKIKSKEIVEA